MTTTNKSIETLTESTAAEVVAWYEKHGNRSDLALANEAAQAVRTGAGGWATEWARRAWNMGCRIETPAAMPETAAATTAAAAAAAVVDLVRFFTADQAPINVFTRQRGEEGWYFRHATTEEWGGPAPYGEDEARRIVAGGLRTR